MNQLVFKFPFAKKYFEQDFLYLVIIFQLIVDRKLAELARQMVKYFWNLWMRKNTFSKILEKKINKIKLIDAKNGRPYSSRIK